MQNQNNFVLGNVSQHILHIAGPMIVAQFINILYNVVDRIYIGRLPDVATLAMSGLGLCLPLISIIIACEFIWYGWFTTLFYSERKWRS